VPLAKAHCKNLPAENTQRQLRRPKPTRVAAPIEEEEEEDIRIYLLKLITSLVKEPNNTYFAVLTVGKLCCPFLSLVLIIRPSTNILIWYINLLLYTATGFCCTDQPLSLG